MTLREIAEKHGRSIHYNMFSHDEVAFLLNAVVEERAKALRCLNEGTLCLSRKMAQAMLSLLCNKPGEIWIGMKW